MKDWKFWWAPPVAMFIGVTGAGLIGQARADTGTQRMEWAVCETLSSYPSAAGVAGIGQALEEQGYTSKEAAEIIVVSVDEECPRWMPLLQSIAEQSGGQEQVA